MAIGTAAAIAGGAGALKSIGGLLQSGKANNILKQLKDPGYKIPTGFYKNLAQAEQLAKTGMPMEQYNLAKQSIDRSMSGGMRNLSRSANPAGLASLVRAGSDQSLSLEAQNAAARRQNILQAMGARRELAGQELAKQQYSQQRYMDSVNQANALKAAGMQNTFGGLGDIASIGLAGGFGGDATKTMGQKLGLSEISRAGSAGITPSFAGNGFFNTLSRGVQLPNIGSLRTGFYDTLSGS